MLCYNRNKTSKEFVMSKMTPVLWLDIDGTIRHSVKELGRFVNKAKDVVIYDGVPEILAKYKAAGWRIVGITNQGDVALGLLSTKDLSANMMRTQALSGCAFDVISACVHHPDAKDFEMRNCLCRKPRIGALVRSGIMLENKYDEIYPSDLGLFVGGRPEDEQCAANAGLKFVWAMTWREGGWKDALERTGLPAVCREEVPLKTLGAFAKYTEVGIKCCIEEEYGICFDDNFRIILASRNTNGYEEQDLYILQHKKSKELQMNDAFHCSCYGFEGQWTPRLITAKYLKNRISKNGDSPINSAIADIIKAIPEGNPTLF
jgi:D-glycero-D-manno-heptose 1,7-bisphosphate phosphatase